MLSHEEEQIFYEKGLLPAVKFLMKEEADRWPAQYIGEMSRARSLSLQPKTIPAWCVSALGESIRRCLAENGCPWGRSLVFLHQIRGVKHSTAHDFDPSGNPHDPQEALEQFIIANHLDVGTLSSKGQWWIDVGLEIGSSGLRCAAWRTDSHYSIVKNICRLENDAARRIAKPGSSQYARDMISHLPAVLGCRITLGPRASGHYVVAYLHMYSTDRSLTCHIDSGHYGKSIACSEILKGKSADYVNRLYQLFLRASQACSSQARIEVRVPFRHATTVLYDLTIYKMRRSLVSISRTIWWYVPPLLSSRIG